MGFGTLLVRLRTEKKISQKELAQYLCLSSSTVSNYENEVHQPDLSTLVRVADLFDVSVDFLLGRTKQRVPIAYLDTPFLGEISIGDCIQSMAGFNERSRGSMLEFMDLLQRRNASEEAVYLSRPGMEEKPLPGRASKPGGSPRGT